MTIRMLENGHYRLQQNLSTRDLQESGRLLENGFLRNNQDGGTRTIEDAQCASCSQPCHCRYQASGLNIWGGPGPIFNFSFNASCGNYNGSSICYGYWTWRIIRPVRELNGNQLPPIITYQDPNCYSETLNCGKVQKITVSKTMSLYSNVFYQFQLFGWSDQECPMTPAGDTFDVFTWSMIQNLYVQS